MFYFLRWQHIFEMVGTSVKIKRSIQNSGYATCKISVVCSLERLKWSGSACSKGGRPEVGTSGRVAVGRSGGEIGRRAGVSMQDA